MRKFPRSGRNGQVVSNFHNLLVIDTNVIVSASLKADSLPAAVLRSVLNGDALMAHDSRILLECREVLARPKFGFSPVLAASPPPGDWRHSRMDRPTGIRVLSGT